jgi:hypothetical protein
VSPVDTAVLFAGIVGESAVCGLVWKRKVWRTLPCFSIYVLWTLASDLASSLILWKMSGFVYGFQLQETFAILRVACFLVMASFSQLLSIGWRDRELQVATGFGLYSIVSLLVTLLHSHQTWSPQYHWLDQALSASYLCTLTYWIFSFATKEQERKEFSPQMQQLLLLMGGGARTGRISLGDLPSEHRRKKD